MILVTGGTGLVGAHLLLHLIENEEKVRAIYRSPQSIEKTKSLFSLYKKETLFPLIEWHEGDITDIPSLEKAFIGIEYVYHCAAIISFDPKDEKIVRKTNIEGTANIVNFCIAKKVQKLCHFSSIAALGDLAEHETILTEENEWNPEKSHSDYAISKYGAEMELWRGQQEGLKSIILNPGIIVGPGFHEQGSGLLFQKVAEGLSYYTNGVTGFIAVADVVRIATELMQSQVSNQRYTLIADNYSFRDIINTMSDALDRKHPKMHLKPWQIEIAWRLDWVNATIFNRKRKLDKYTAKASYTKMMLSNDKIKKELKTTFLDIHQYIKDIAKL